MKILSVLLFTCLVLLRGASVAVGGDLPQIAVFSSSATDPVTGEKVTVRHNASSLRFELQPNSKRYRYKLEGLDEDWVPQGSAMNFFVRFQNKDHDQIDQKLYAANGDSSGWNGTVESSSFTSREEELRVPEGADSVGIGFSSSGPPETVGFYALAELSVHVPSLEMPREFLSPSEPIPGESASLWNRSGTHPSMASTRLLGDEGRNFRVLITEDHDILGHADWAVKLEHRPSVIPGEILSIRWKEAYSIGVGDPISVNYDRIPPGKYRFVVEGLDLAGRATGQIYSIDVEVTQPLWRSLWFWAAMLISVGTFSSLWARHVVRRRTDRERRHSQLIADERLRIARDLHDDLGTRLSHINLLGSHGQGDRPGGDARESLQQITRMSRELMGTLSETVWMLNPNNGNLESLVDYLCRLVGELCKLAEIRCRIDALSVDESMPISHEFRHNVSLAVKETINNALKHASASEIQMKIVKAGSSLDIVIEDDGVGFGSNPNKAGSGLESVSQRMAAIGGNSALEQVPDGGVRVTLTAPIRA